MTDSDTTDRELEELREQTTRGSRLETPADHSEEIADEDPFVDRLVETMIAVERGDVPKSLSLRDDTLSALLRTLDEDDARLEQVADQLADQLDEDLEGAVDRSLVLRLAIRVGLHEAAPDLVDEVRSARAEAAAQLF